MAALPEGTATADVPTLTRKVAQLTKVIVALNAQREDHVGQLKRLQSQHDNDLEKATAAADKRVTALEQKLAAVTQRVEAATQEAQKAKSTAREYHASKAKLAAQFDALGRKAQAETQQVQGLLETRREECSVLRTKLQELSQRVEKVLAEKQEEVERLQTVHACEVKELVEAALQERNQLQQTHEQQLAEHEKKAHKAAQGDSSVAAQLREQLKKAQQDHAEEVRRLRHNFETELAEQQKQAHSDFSNAQTKWAACEQVLKAQLDELHSSLQTGENTASSQVSALRQQLAAEQQRVRDADNEIRQAKKDTAARTTALHKASAELEDLKRDHDALRQTTDNLQLYSQKQEQALEASAADVARLQAALDKAKGSAEQLGSEQHSLQERLDAMAETHRQELFEAQQVALRRQQELLDDHRTQAAAGKREHDAAMVACRDEIARLSDTLQENRDEAQKEQRQLREQLDRTSGQLDASLKRIAVKEESLAEAQAQLQDQHQQVKGLESELDEQRVQNETLKAEVDNLQQSIEKQQDETKASIAALKAEAAAKLTEARETLRKEMQDQQQRLASQSSATAGELQTQLAAAQGAVKRTESLLKDAASDLKQEQQKTAQLAAQLNTDTKRLTEQLEQSKETARKLKAELHAVSAVLERERHENRQTLLKAADIADKRFQQLQAQSASELATAKSAFEKQVQEALDQAARRNKEFGSQQDCLRAELESARAAANMAAQQLEEMTIKQQQELDQKQQMQKRGLEEMSKMQAAECARLTAELQAAQRDFEFRCDNYARAAETLQDELHKAQLEAQQAAEANKMLEQEVDQREVELLTLHSELKRKGNEILSVRREANETLNATTKKLQDKHRQQMEDIVSQYRHQFSQAQQTASAMVTELQAKFDARPSREEDTDRIAMLADALATAEQRVRSLQTKVDRLTGEVVSREKAMTMFYKPRTVQDLQGSPKGKQKLMPLPPASPRGPPRSNRQGSRSATGRL
eukprot:m.197555 g.197555  ORF g.197555 m.197555 type:complete len:990 (+) comp18349_c0_seq3:191-3160(+)